MRGSFVIAFLLICSSWMPFASAEDDESCNEDSLPEEEKSTVATTTNEKTATTTVPPTTTNAKTTTTTTTATTTTATTATTTTDKADEDEKSPCAHRDMPDGLNAKKKEDERNDHVCVHPTCSDKKGALKWTWQYKYCGSYNLFDGDEDDQGRWRCCIWKKEYKGGDQCKPIPLPDHVEAPTNLKLKTEDRSKYVCVEPHCKKNHLKAGTISGVKRVGCWDNFKSAEGRWRCCEQVKVE